MIWRPVAVALLCAGLVGCLQRVPTEIVGVTRVDMGPTGAPIGNTDAVMPLGEGPFVKISFSSDRDFAALASADRMSLHYDFFVCQARDQYIQSGDIYSERPGVYAAYIPANFDRLSYWVTGRSHGEIGRGWPDELEGDFLCFTVRGGVPYERRVIGPTIRLPMDVHELFEASASEPGFVPQSH